MNLGRDIIHILLNHPTVYVEGLGQFSRIYISAKYEAEEGTYLPPVTYIEFDPYGTDGLNFIQYLQKAKEGEYSQIQEQVEKVVFDLKEEVRKEGSAIIHHLGHLLPHGESFVFKPLDLSGFNFEKVSEIEPLKTQNELASLSPDFSETNEKEEENEEPLEAPYHTEERIGDLHDPHLEKMDSEAGVEFSENKKENTEEAPYRSEERTADLHESISAPSEEADEEPKQPSDAHSFHAVIQSEEGQVRNPDVFTKNEEVSETSEQELNTEGESEVLEAQPQDLDGKETHSPEKKETSESERTNTTEEEEEPGNEAPDWVAEDQNPKRKSAVWYIVGGILLVGLLAVGYFMYLQGDIKDGRSQGEEISQEEVLEERPVAEPVQEDLKEANQQAEREGIEEETVENEERVGEDKHQIVIGAHKSLQDAEEQRDGFLEKGISTVRIVSRDREGPAQHMVIWDSFTEREKADSVLRIVRSKHVRDAWRKDL